MAARWRKNRLVTNEGIRPGQVIVGFSSSGKATYEKEYNSGIGSNGLTSARHDMFSSVYARKYPESFDPHVSSEVVYIGRHTLTDTLDIGQEKITAGKLVLSPTRTYAPLIKAMLSEHFDAIKGMIHCSGGGQTKCLKYLPGPMKVVKDNFFEVPPVFKLIQEASGAQLNEMIQVFNMGCRLEVFTEESHASQLISMANSFGIEARVIGRVEASTETALEMHIDQQVIQFKS